MFQPFVTDDLHYIVLDKPEVFWYVVIGLPKRVRTYFLFVLHTIY